MRAGQIRDPRPALLPSATQRPGSYQLESPRMVPRRSRAHRCFPGMDRLMTDYETLRSRHAQQAEDLIPDHQARIMWSDEQLGRERVERLRALLTVAKERSPWHRERLRHISAGTAELSDLRSIPPMTKPDMMANLDGIYTDRRLSPRLVEEHLNALDDDRYLLDEFHVVSSGGSSGTRGVFVYDWNGW